MDSEKQKRETTLVEGVPVVRFEESWRLVERYIVAYPNDWRLVFKRDDEVLEVPVPQEVWHAFDAPTRGEHMSARRVPVMVRGAGGHAPSGYHVHREYKTFEEAAKVVAALRRDPTIAWAFIPDEYANFGFDTRDCGQSRPTASDVANSDGKAGGV